MNVLFNPRALANAMLRGAMRIAPVHAAEWGEAMLGELHYVEGNWSALAWAVGGASVLMKHALFSLLVPGQAGQTASSNRHFFAKEKPMRKSTIIAAAACLAASLLFFAAPAFRQAFGISLTQWHSLVRSLYGADEPRYPDTDFLRIADTARKNHDAEALAYVAMHGWGDPSAAAIADEAVRMDPKLTWIYAVVARRNSSWPEIDGWIVKLEQFDPENALPHLIAAEQATYRSVMGGKYRFGQYESDTAWQKAMAAAFASARVDTYADRLQQLNFDVARRYGVDSPSQIESQYFLSMGIASGLGNSVDYAKSLLQSGDDLAAHGDSAGALKQYWTAIHFGEMIRPPQHRTYDAYRNGIFANVLLEESYKHLAAFYSARGDRQQAEFFGYLVTTGEQARSDDRTAARQRFAGTPAERWNANILGVSGIALFLCGGVLLACAVMTAVKSLSAQPRKLLTGRFTNVLAGASAVGLLLSTAALYLSYRPYDELVRAYLQDGDPSHLQTLTVFLNYLNYDAYLPRVGTLYDLRDFPISFWAVTIALCAIALIYASARFIAKFRDRAVAA